MNELAIRLAEDRSVYRPGEELAGEASWEMEGVPEAVELRLFWHTKGKGTVDSETVEVVRFERPGVQENRQFRISLPRGPYSFSGKLISLIWALELAARPGKFSGCREITVSPTGAEVELTAVASADANTE